MKFQLAVISAPRSYFQFCGKRKQQIYIIFCGFLLNNLMYLLLNEGFNNPSRTCLKIDVGEARFDSSPIF